MRSEARSQPFEHHQPAVTWRGAATGQPQRGWVYTLQLRLEDATGELDALLFDEDGTDFFQVPACQQSQFCLAFEF